MRVNNLAAIFVLIALSMVFVYLKPIDDYNLVLPKGFPEPTFPQGNELTTARVKLGEKIFFDPIVSRDSSISCASCHMPELAFADTARFSLGVEGRLGARNSPSILNVAYHKGFMRDGGMTSLEMQVLAPVQEHVELDNNVLHIVEKMKRIPEYVEMSKRAYNREPDPYVFTRAIGAYERTLIQANSPYDDYKNNGNKKALNNSAKRGMKLFNSAKTNCTKCHSGFLFSNFATENNGLYQQNYADSGLMRVTKKEEDRDMFKVPSLRNVSITPPYMHDGSIATLKDVIEHYNNGGKNHPHQSEFIRPLNLSKKDREDLLQFLLALTDKQYLN